MAIKTNAKINKPLLAVHSVFRALVKRKQNFDINTEENLFQGSLGTQLPLLILLNRYTEEVKVRIGISFSYRTLSQPVSLCGRL